ncbi:PAS domain S-box protein [Fimbriiglobus ruber]|nr:PAS domain S-box protein [Fimbriiglobus ruber]
MPPDVPETVLAKWQGLVDTLSMATGASASLVTRIAGNDLEVLVASNTEGNPFCRGDRERLIGSNSYCETVLRERRELQVTGVRTDDRWAQSPAGKKNLISYIGYPILGPNREPFGTICVLDRKPRSYSDLDQRLVSQFRDMIQDYLEFGRAEAARNIGHPRPSIATDKSREVVSEGAGASNERITSPDITDVDARKETENDLRESERRFRQLLEDAGDGYFLHDEKGRITEVNRRACDSLGYTHDELLALNVTDIVTNFHSAELLAIWATTAPGESDTFADHSHRRKDGTTFPVEVRVTCYSIRGEKLFLGVVRDVTERVNAEENLRLSEERFRLLVEHASDGFFLHDDQGRFLDVNHQACATTLYRRNDLLGMSLADIEVDHDAERYAALLKQAKTGGAVTAVTRVRRQDGSDFPVEVRLTRCDIHGQELYLALVRDITARVEAERALLQINVELEKRVAQRTEALRQREAQWQFAVESTGGGMWDWDPESGQMNFSRQWREMLGYAEHEIEPTLSWWSGLIHHEDRVRCTASLRRFSRTVGPVNWEFRFRARDGRWRWIASSGLVVDLTPDGRPLRVIGIHTDTTSRKESEERIRSLSERTQLAIKAGRIGIWELDFDTGRLIWDNQMHALYGMASGNFRGCLEEWFEQIHPDDAARIRAEWEAAVAETSVFESEFRVTHSDGTDRHLRALADVSRRPDGSPLRALGTNWDVTEHRQLVGELRKAKLDADAANRAKSDFLANMSHEIRTPMNGILGMADLALDTDLAPEQQEFVKTIRSSAESLLTVINDVLDFSKIEAGKLDLDPFDFPLHDSLGDMLRPLALRAHKKGLELAFETPAEVPDELHGDWNRLRQILVNLVGNAIKFTDQGEVVVGVRVADAPDPDGLTLQFTVRDTGIGIPAVKREAIFAPFEQADGTTTRRFGGTGLGLAICSRLVDMMGGRIWVESEVGRGSTFHFTVRLSTATGPTGQQSAPAPDYLRGMPVLVVDDNTTNLLILEGFLKRWEMRPTCVANGEAALAALTRAAEKGEPFPLVLLDTYMPGMDGLDLVERVRLDPALASVTILMLSSADRQDYLRRCRECRVAAYLIKPVGRAELLEAIRQVLTVSDPRGNMVSPAANPLVIGGTTTVDLPRGLNILLAEDNAVNQRVAQLMLERHGHRVRLAGNGREAIELAGAEAFDLVLMDVQMPEVDGLEAVAAIRAAEQGTGRHLPVIALTAYAMMGDRERFLAVGMDGYVAKPLRPELFWEEIRRVVPFSVQSPPAISTQPPFVPPRDVVFDREAALERAGGDAEIFRELIRLFRGNADEYLDHLRDAVRTGNVATARRIAHTIRGPVGIFGAAAAETAARRLEAAAADGDLDNGTELFGQLEDEIRRLLAALDEAGGG